MGDESPWDAIHQSKPSTGVSWYRAHLERSLECIERITPSRAAAILDVGGGASTLVDDLLDRGYLDVTVLDIAASAIEAVRRRLGPRATKVGWIVGDVTRQELAASRFDFWHDRAVFHFLTESADRRKYAAAARRAIKPGGHLLMATFGPSGPQRCSGMPVVRYSAAGLSAELGAGFALLESSGEIHRTPSGGEQEFTYCLFRVG